VSGVCASAPGLCCPALLGLLPPSGCVVPFRVWGWGSRRRVCVCMCVCVGLRVRVDRQDVPVMVGSFHVSDNGLVCAVPPCS